MTYLIPERDDFDIQRADMSLGMRRASRFYSELVVPGIGGAWRVRHLSWSVAGIFIKQQLQCKHSAIAIGHGIEALGNKIEWHVSKSDNTQEIRIRGIRAFARNPESWSFAELHQKRFYVQITHRQQCTRALPNDIGLGFTEGSSRFNAMSLTPIGMDLARAFMNQVGVGKGRPKILTQLTDWIISDFDPAESVEKLKQALCSSAPTKEERQIVFGRLQSLVPDSFELGHRDSHRRERLMRFLEVVVADKQDWNDTEELLRWLEANDGILHAMDIRTAIAFEDMRLAGISLLGRIAQILGTATSHLSMRDCINHALIKIDLEVFRQNAKQYINCAECGKNSRPDAMAFAQETNLDDEGIIRNLLKRDGRILSLANGVIYPGSVFRPDIRGGLSEQDPDMETNFEGRPNRLFQFISLWRDCHEQK